LSHFIFLKVSPELEFESLRIGGFDIRNIIRKKYEVHNMRYKTKSDFTMIFLDILYMNHVIKKCIQLFMKNKLSVLT
jgi:hypothetical protein